MPPRSFACWFSPQLSHAPQHPEWKDKEPFASLLRGDVKAVLASSGDHGLMELFMATHTGMTTDEFAQFVRDWIATAKHPTTGKRFVDMTYQPMLEVLAYLRANDFKNFIVSGGGIEFMRVWTEAAYGIPPEQVIGSSMKTKFELRDGKSVLVRLAQLNFNDDKADKPVGINQHIGRRPIAAFGNSVGDQQMLEYAQGGSGARFELLVLHDDAAREFAYGPARGLPDVKYGFFTPALEDHAKKDGWTVVSMKDDWKTVFPAAQSEITAIDILLEPDATMLGHSVANNARLLKIYPKGFPLDEAHMPHITMLQCYARTADLDKLYAAVGQVLAAAQVTALKSQGYVTSQFGKNHQSDCNGFLPTVHGFDEWYGNLYHLNAEAEPEELDYPGQVNPKQRTAEQSGDFTQMFGPRGMFHIWATEVDDPDGSAQVGPRGQTKNRGHRQTHPQAHGDRSEVSARWTFITQHLRFDLSVVPALSGEAAIHRPDGLAAPRASLTRLP